MKVVPGGFVGGVVADDEDRAGVELFVLLVAAGEFRTGQIQGELEHLHASQRAGLRRLPIGLEFLAQLLGIGQLVEEVLEPPPVVLAIASAISPATSAPPARVPNDNPPVEARGLAPPPWPEVTDLWSRPVPVFRFWDSGSAAACKTKKLATTNVRNAVRIISYSLRPGV